MVGRNGLKGMSRFQRIGIIGGSGLEKLDIFDNRKELHIESSYGSTSSSFFNGKYNDLEVYILSRHGRKHEIPPHEVNNRANIDAFKTLNVEGIIATSACGSLRDEIKRGDLVLPDQLIDFTKNRISTFHDTFIKGLEHISFGEPFDSDLRATVLRIAQEARVSIHPTGTLVTIEGPRFSTRAESKMFRIWGADIVNMSVAPEAALAREAGIPYCVVAMSTDYDAWKEDEEPVSWQEVLNVFKDNASKVEMILKSVLKHLSML